MFEKLETSWKLAKESWQVLLLDKEMLWFPALSFLTSICFLAGVGGLVWANAYVASTPEAPIVIPPLFSTHILLTAALLTIVPTYILYVVVSFFNSALVTCALIRLHGEDPILADGFSHAWRRAGAVFRWSLLAATAGLVLRFFKKRNSMIVSLLGEFLSLGWRVATFFVIPIIVAENKGAVDSFKGSIGLIKKTWGEALTFEIGLHLLSIPLVVPAALVFYTGLSMLESMPGIAIALVCSSLTFIFVVSIVLSTLDAIIKAALYLHATGGLDSRSFDPRLLDGIVKRTSAEKPALA